MLMNWLMNIITYLRQFRLFGFAIFDFTAAYVGIFLLSPVLTKLAKRLRLNLTTRHWLRLTLPIGVLVHLIFKIQTPLVEEVLDLHGHYLIKVILLVMIFMGLKDIRKKE